MHPKYESTQVFRHAYIYIYISTCCERSREALQLSNNCSRPRQDDAAPQSAALGLARLSLAASRQGRSSGSEQHSRSSQGRHAQCPSCRPKSKRKKCVNKWALPMQPNYCHSAVRHTAAWFDRLLVFLCVAGTAWLLRTRVR